MAKATSYRFTNDDDTSLAWQRPTGAEDETLKGKDGNDTLGGGGGNDTIKGQDGDDTIYGNTGDDVIDGGKGDDTIYGGDDDDQILGGKGNDIIYTGDGFDAVDAGRGDDTVYAKGDSYVLGGKGDDTLYGNGYINDLRGGEGEDRFFHGQNGVTILTDWEVGESIGYDVSKNGEPTVFEASEDLTVISWIDSVDNGEKLDEFFNDLFEQAEEEGSTQEELFSQSNLVFVFGAKVEDVEDALDPIGEAPVDPEVPPVVAPPQDNNDDDHEPEFAQYTRYNWNLPESQSEHAIFTHNDSILSRAGYKLTTLADDNWNKVVVEDGVAVGSDPWVEGVALEDQVTVNDWIIGSPEEDALLHGYQGDDVIQAAQGEDLLRGGKGNDVLIAGAGNDIIYGGKGNDLYFGRDGIDTFILGEGDNVIVDYEAGVDVLGFLAPEQLKFEETEFGVLATYDGGTAHLLGANINSF